MQFSDFYGRDQPSLDIHCEANAIVFDADGTQHLERLSPECRLVYLLWCFVGEIQNGGFDQLFFNSLGDQSVEILNGLHVIGAKVSHDLLRQALTWFPDSMPASDRDERGAQCEKFSGTDEYSTHIEELNRVFYKDDDRLESLIDAYVMRNPTASLRSSIQVPPTTRRNELCPCGSGQRYKKCCGKVSVALSPAESLGAPQIFLEIVEHFKKHQINGVLSMQYAKLNGVDQMAFFSITNSTGDFKVLTLALCLSSEDAELVEAEIKSAPQYSHLCRNGKVVLACTFMPPDAELGKKIHETFVDFSSRT